MTGGGATPVPGLAGAPIPQSGFTASVVDASRLDLPPGRVVVLEAQVLGRTADGTVRLATRHGTVDIRTAAPLQPGTTAMIEFTRGAGDQLTLRVIPVLSPRNLLSILDAFQASGPGGATGTQQQAATRGSGATLAPAPGNGLDRSDGVTTGGARATAVVLPPARSDASGVPQADQPEPASPAPRAAATAGAARAPQPASIVGDARSGLPAVPASATPSDPRATPAPQARPAAASTEPVNAMRIDPPPSSPSQQRATQAAGGDRIVVAGSTAQRPDAPAPAQTQPAAMRMAAGAAPAQPAAAVPPSAPGPAVAPRLGATSATGTALAPQPSPAGVATASPAAGAARAMLAPGSTVELRIDMAAIQAQRAAQAGARAALPAPPALPQATGTAATAAASGGTMAAPASGGGDARGAAAAGTATRMLPLPATVAGTLPQGRLILDTPLGRLAVAVPPDLAHALAGEKLELSYLPDTIRNAARPAGGEPPASEGGRRWTDARSVATALASAPDPALRAAAERLVPAPGPRLAQQMMAFVAQADGALANWVGEEAARVLEKLGLGEALQRGGAPAQPADQGARQADGAWRHFTLPFLDGAAVRPIQVRARRRREQRGGRPREQSRFVVDCVHDDLGEIQIDGLMTTGGDDRRLDVVFRSHGALDEDDRVAILDLFGDACGAMGLSGDLAFQVLERFPPVAGSDAGRRDVVA